SPLLTSLLDGYNVCIMAYGQTGSGKTYTMLGPHSDDNFFFPMEDDPELGIIPRATEEVFRLLSERPLESHCVEVSVVEVYNNEVFDLLAKDNSGRTSGVRRDIITNKEGKSDIPLLTHEPVEDAAEFLELVHKGLQLRVTHPTLVHAHSSRSHLVLTLTITTKATLPGSLGKPPHLLCFYFNIGHVEEILPFLIDGLSSAVLGMSGVTGSVLRETSFINRSLSALADVLGAISEQRSHVPYRNSKLTHLLQDSIGGDAKLLLVLCVSPSQKYITESLQTLGFGSRAQQVQRGQAKKRNQLVLSRSK
uniref:Kinesin family member 25 n=1 Tax=Varanus komodoensis TaxID=61221 RepID=A0A8D2IU69_VARKO